MIGDKDYYVLREYFKVLDPCLKEVLLDALRSHFAVIKGEYRPGESADDYHQRKWRVLRLQNILMDTDE